MTRTADRVGRQIAVKVKSLQLDVRIIKRVERDRILQHDDCQIMCVRVRQAVATCKTKLRVVMDNADHFSGVGPHTRRIDDDGDGFIGCEAMRRCQEDCRRQQRA